MRVLKRIMYYDHDDNKSIARNNRVGEKEEYGLILAETFTWASISLGSYCFILNISSSEYLLIFIAPHRQPPRVE